MLVGLYIFLDDEFEDPIYGDPATADLEPELWVRACEAVNDALDEERSAEGVETSGEYHVGWRCFVRQGVSFVAMVTDDVKASDVDRYLAQLAKRYMDEVDDARNPEREGVEDVVVDVIPPWEEGDED
jgi:hypothetical protein